jgi:hypothetical protein
VAGFKARQCRGDSQTGLMAEVPAIPPTNISTMIASPIVVHILTADNSNLSSRALPPVAPPPRS